MRYKVKAPDLPVYRDVLELLTGRVPVLVASEKRRSLSIEDLPEDCRQEITARGAEVTPEYQYDMEAR